MEIPGGSDTINEVEKDLGWGKGEVCPNIEKGNPPFGLV